MDILRADYQVTVKSLQYEVATSDKITIAAGEIWVQDFTLTPYDPFAQFRNLGITIKDAFSGEPLEGVFVSSYDANTNRYEDSQTTLSNGMYSLNLKEGVHDVTIYKDGYVTEKIDSFATSTSQDTTLEVAIQKIFVNRPPIINSLTTNPSSNPLTIETEKNVSLFCYATDPDNNRLTFLWDKTGGAITESGSIATWTALSSPGTYTVDCKVSDGKNESDLRGVDINVIETAVAQSDLLIQNLSITPTSGLSGSSATMSFAIYNQGSGTANASTTNIRIEHLNEQRDGERSATGEHKHPENIAAGGYV